MEGENVSGESPGPEEVESALELGVVQFCGVGRCPPFILLPHNPAWRRNIGLAIHFEGPLERGVDTDVELAILVFVVDDGILPRGNSPEGTGEADLLEKKSPAQDASHYGVRRAAYIVQGAEFTADGDDVDVGDDGSWAVFDPDTGGASAHERDLADVDVDRLIRPVDF
ncbi:MAG TPA: hypothetical protein VGF55_24855, partial [Gemmataceae bacterium]